MGESRTELLQWLNELLQINYNKIEQCGTGGAYCQIIDSIYGESRARNRVFSRTNSEWHRVGSFPGDGGWSRRYPDDAGEDEREA